MPSFIALSFGFANKPLFSLTCETGYLFFPLLLTFFCPPPSGADGTFTEFSRNFHNSGSQVVNTEQNRNMFHLTCFMFHLYDWNLDLQIEIPAHSGIEVPLTFSPSALGLGRHTAEIVFKSDKVCPKKLHFIGNCFTHIYGPFLWNDEHFV